MSPYLQDKELLRFFEEASHLAVKNTLNYHIAGQHQQGELFVLDKLDLLRY